MEPTIKDYIINAMQEAKYQHRHEEGPPSEEILADFIAADVAEAIWEKVDGLPKVMRERLDTALAPFLGTSGS